MSNQFKRILLSTVVIGSLGLTACDDQPPVDDYDKSACRAVSPDFDYTNLENLNMANFPTSNDVWSSLQDMVDFGPRHTASQADLNFLDYLEVRMEKMGLESITRDPVRVSGHNIMSHYSAPRSGLTYHLSGILPGMTDEVIVLGVHVDGQNSIEENGVIILLEIAEYLATVPKECRRHTFALVFANGHMASTDSSEAGGWASNHPDIMDRAVGFVSPEHVGFLYSPGNPIPFQFMATHGNLQDKSNQLIADMKLPDYEVSTLGIGTGGAWMLVSGGKPVVGGMTAQIGAFFAGLFDPDVGMEAVDKDIFYDTTVLFARLTGYMDGKSADELRK